ncbi:MAG: intein-containing RctB family protein [Desulfurococcales archaeon]|nr:intein-containing RctB family protein [Desulfurococcales archaeon]
MSSRIRLEKVDRFEWIIPRDAKSCMRVPAVIFADEYLLEKMRSDLTLVQATNVACLPGIYRAAFVMPDGHQGYGFPIGGVAGFDAEEGVISPGGVGYDINCLTPDTRVLDEYGAWRYIRDLKPGEKVIVNDGKIRSADIVFWFYRLEEKIYVIKTRTGLVLKASHDHPILTSRGMINIRDLKKGMKVAIYPFEGVRYEKPPKKLLLDINDFDRSIARELTKRGLLPLYTDNPKLPIIIKLIGYFTGDGSFDGKKTWFYGDKEGLEEIRNDIKKLGYSPSKIITRKKKVHYKGKEINGVENAVYVSARSFSELLEKLGAPKGRKISTPFTVPQWIKELPLWMKRLYLAAYFGAEMNKPQTINGYNFEQPFISITKIRELEENAVEFLRDIARMLGEFNVRVLDIMREVHGDKIRLKLRISTRPKSLINLWSRIGYIYNPVRHRLGLAAVAWLKYKIHVLGEREEAAKEAIRLHSVGAGPREIMLVLTKKTQWINRRFIERVIYSGVKEARIPKNFQSFEEWIKSNVSGDIIWDVVEDISVENYNGYVYDIMVDDKAHNFIANGIIVSNCGVRLLRTNLDYSDVKPRLKDLVNALFRNIPSGVGSTGRVRLSINELSKVLDEGVEWAISKGFGWSDDPEHIEERGSWREADSSKVSHRAKQRGHNQLGTLGAGNHFLEIQVVEKIYAPGIAKVLGITHEGQVTVMIHTGSRGLGHQVASDYLLVMERAMRKYGIRPPDRELASLPFKSTEAQNYFKAMAAAANFAWTNRQLITHWTRESFRQVFHKDPDQLDLHIIYDVAHNIAKIEEHDVDGRRAKIVVHRKGATRAFPPGHPEIPKDHKSIGQVVLIPGSMGTASYVLVGTHKGARTWYSAPHGAGRWMSRHAAIRAYSPSRVQDELMRKGIVLRAATRRVVAEEAPGAYKDVDRVVEVAHHVGIGRLVVKLKPIGVVKG